MNIINIKIKIQLKILISGFVLFGLFLVSNTQAGDHPYSKFEYDPQKGIGYFDLVVSLDWNPSQAERDGKLKNAFENYAKTVYDATEGNHKLRKIYVYLEDAEKSSCDIYIQNKAGRAHAYFNSFGKGGLRKIFGTRINMFMSNIYGGERTGWEIGVTLAHEFGHYVFGLFDEYAESSDVLTLPWLPHTHDEGCSSIMHSKDFQDFCYDENHTLVNAQHRMHKASCWSTLVRDSKNDPWSILYIFYPRRTKYDGLVYPSEGTYTQPGGDDELEIIYVEESRSQVVLIIDSSGSMGWYQKIELAKAAAKQFVDLLQIGDKLAVVSYRSYVTTNWSMSEITGPPPQTNIKAAIEALYASGTTAMGDAMRTALNILINQADPYIRRGAILLSNGLHNYGREHPNNVVPDYISEGIPIYTIALGSDANKTLMQQIANQTGGSYYFAPGASDLQEIYAAITQQTTATEQLVETFSETLALNESVGHVIVVDSTVEDITFLVSWDSGDTMLLELVTPSGQVISPTNVGIFPNVSYAAESTYALYRVQTPDIGNWTLQITATNITNTGAVAGQVQAEADIHFSISVESDTISYPTPIGIAGALRKNLNIASASVIAEISTPDGSEIILDLHDNGESPDFAADDGIYSGLYSDYTLDGEYEIVVTATNPNLEAAEMDKGLLEQGEHTMWIPIGEQFLRSDKIKVNVSGVMMDDHGDTFGEATYIPADNTPVWGKIEESGDIDFFKFDAVANKMLTLRTSQLIPPMDTFITLYDEDGTTVIEKDDNNGGGVSSMIIWRAPHEGTYYIKVEHASLDTGGYHLTEGLTQEYEIIYPPLNFTGEKVLNRSLYQAEYINVLKWEANPNNENKNIVKYRIYQKVENTQSLMIELDVNQFEYWHRKVEKDKEYTYALVAVNNENKEGEVAYITIQ